MGAMITENQKSNGGPADEHQKQGGSDGSPTPVDAEIERGDKDLGLSAEEEKADDEDAQNQSALNSKWEETFQRLVKFKEEHGHCLVPNRYPEDPQLGSWGEFYDGFPLSTVPRTARCFLTPPISCAYGIQCPHNGVSTRFFRPAPVCPHR